MELRTPLGQETFAHQSWVLGIGYWVLGIGYWVLGIELGTISNTQYPIPNPDEPELNRESFTAESAESAERKN